MTINFDQFTPADSATPPPSSQNQGQPQPSRAPFYFLVASASILALVAIIVLFMFTIGQGRYIAQAPTAQEKSHANSQDKAHSPQAPADPHAPHDPGSDSSKAVNPAPLQDAVSTSSCDQPNKDTAPFFDYVVAATSAHEWFAPQQKVVTDALATLNQRCRHNVPHLLALQQAFVDPQAPPQMNALVKDAAWITRERPAPATAQAPTGRFTTGLQNIHCSIGADGAACTIHSHHWDAGGCGAKPTTFTISSISQGPRISCGSPIVAETSYDYGTALANHGYVCSLESVGVSCWSEFTGHGFELSRENFREF
ncbi:hypothetical protein [Arcanobacterium haemolyticum]|uniref:Uncharacterized protein n=1 Tax=Arcanobacterium haemolyticum (strain ATCC 9345 / DSM 20595 / CCM 5947 / CCUG 17215 / LMG 16163 / NBRC 15585 / NCTC 8452 / 11018) TaxID=644284 RepID=D7BLV3_ARCHD|nr:hypothetical protein [Arcanobacterium haemolyticum]ADH91902.1 hypothetical protein Arch_0139 [Arcanobacterium haemolyticum DSM 20595]SQH27022.1 Uncharacterised protein [Arcanobacterium haemolyticum]